MTTPKKEPAEHKFNVVDRRHWADKSDEDGRPDRPQKPSYVEDLEGQLKEREAKLTDTVSRHRAAVAEFEESRTRLQRDVSQEVERQKKLMLIEFLDILDNLDRAAEAAARTSDAAAVRKGVDMVREQFLAKLGGFGVVRRDSLHQKFDPVWHDAVTQMPVTKADDEGVVLGVVQEGYAINGEPLRPARVAVGTKSN